MYKYSINIPALFLVLLLPGLYLSDVLYGVFNYIGIKTSISPGTVIRGGVFVLALVIIIFHYRKLPLKWSAILFALFMLPIPGMIISIIDNMSLSTVFLEFQSIAKILFGPVMICLFTLIIRKWNVPYDMVMKNIEYSFYLLGISLLLMQSLDIGEKTYGDFASGSKGVFGPQNDISLSLGLAMVVTVYRNIIQFGIIRFILMAFSIFGFVGIGTRTSLLLTIAIPIVVVIMLLFSRSDQWKRRHRVRLLVLIAPLFMVVISYAGYYTYQQLSQYNYQVAKYEVLSSGSHPREELLNLGWKHLNYRDIIVNVFGVGASNYRQDIYQYFDAEKEHKKRMVEVDWMDLYGQYGLLFTLFLHAVVLSILARAMWFWLAHRDPLYGVGAIALGVYLGHSVLAGHALTSPIPSGLVAAICAVLLVGQKRTVLYPASAFTIRYG